MIACVTECQEEICSFNLTSTDFPLVLLVSFSCFRFSCPFSKKIGDLFLSETKPKYPKQSNCFLVDVSFKQTFFFNLLLKGDTKDESETKDPNVSSRKKLKEKAFCFRLKVKTLCPSLENLVCRFLNDN